jgi:hypothetical protein
VYSGLIGSPDIVENGASRSGVRLNVSRSQRSSSPVGCLVVATPQV